MNKEFKRGDVVVKIGDFTKFVVFCTGNGWIEVNNRDTYKTVVYSTESAYRNFVKVGVDRRFVHGK